jgi:hypothetical protein
MKIQIKKIETKIKVQKYVMRVPTRISFEKERNPPTSKGKKCVCFHNLPLLHHPNKLHIVWLWAIS